MPDWMLRSARRAIAVVLGCCLQAFGVAANAADGPTNIDYFGLHIHRADQGTAWPAVRFGSWRLWDAYVSWSRLQPQADKWDFSRLDRYVAMARLTKVDLLLPLGLTPSWASARPNEVSHYDKGNAAEPRDMELWRQYVRMVAERYKGRITKFEIWNEVNDAKFYSGSPEVLTQLTCEANKILKEIDPGNMLAGPSVTEVGRHLKWHEDFLRLGGGKCVDAMTHHFYAPNEEPEGMIKKIRAVRDTLDKFGAGALPLWNTETGWLIGNDDGTPLSPGYAAPYWKRFEAADSDWLIARALILARAEGIDRFYWYAWDHTALGLVEPQTRALKPGAGAFDRVAKWLVGVSIQPCRQQGDVWSCAILRGGTAEGWIAWSVSGVGKFLWPGPIGPIVVEALGGGSATGQMKEAQHLPVTRRPSLFKIGAGVK